MATLAEIRAKLAAAQSKKESGSFTDNAVYRFWNIPEKSTAVIRFLPDADPTADYFWQERQVIRLPFSGIKGQDENKEVYVTVPCMKMFGEVDPILAATKDWWDEPDLKEMARKYWIKRSYVFQGFVTENPYKDDVEKLPENPIRRFIINSSIFKIIQESLMNPEMESIPTDYEHGRDFKITKNKKGDWADYSTSNWSFKERALSVAELEAIEQHKLFNLKDFLPTKPTDAQKTAIMEMFAASVDGQPYDEKLWGEFYRPSGLKSDGDTGGEVVAGNAAPKTTVSVSVPVEEPAVRVEYTEEPVVEQTPVVSEPVSALSAIEKMKAKMAASSAETSVPASDSKPKADAQAILDLIKSRSASN